MMRSHRPQLKFLSSMILGISLAVGLAIALQHFNLQSLLQNALLWVQNLGTTGILAYILLYNLATVLFIPGSLLTLGGGALYGVVWGSLYVFIAATLGAIFAFLIGRYLARNWVSQKVEGNPRFKAIDAAVEREGLKIVLLTRLSPIFPFNLLNYALGLTRVSLKDYAIGSIGMIPGTILYVYIGSLAGDLASLGRAQTLSAEARAAQWIVKIVGFLATVAVTVYVTRLAKKALNESIESE